MLYSNNVITDEKFYTSPVRHFKVSTFELGQFIAHLFTYNNNNQYMNMN